MFLKEIYLKNYKCFEEATFSFEKRFTVLIGENGSGKTAALDGIARGLKGLRDYLVPENIGHRGYPLSRDDFDTSLSENEIRVIPSKKGSKIALEKQFPYNIKTTIFTKDKVESSWHFSNSGSLATYPHSYVSQLKLDVEGRSEVILPILVYYRTSRNWPNEKYENLDLYPIGSRLDTYKDCLTPNIGSKVIQEWFKRMAVIQFQEEVFPPELKAVSKAIIKALEGLRKDKNGIVKADFSAANDELMIDIGDGKEFPFRLLSEGYRNTLGLIADIAYRMAELNPHVTTDTPGVVLIDEIDLHLHPKWQRNIVGDLKRIFPNCQFIVTTHSPFIIQSLDVDDGIIRLDNEHEEVPEDFVNQSIEDIVEDMQGVENPQWSRKKTEMYEAAKQYFQTLDKMNSKKDEAEIQRLKEELEFIKKPYAMNVAYLAFLEQKTLVKEAQLQRESQVVNDPESQATYKKTQKN